jgi:predicted nucleic acid-binding protein
VTDVRAVFIDSGAYAALAIGRDQHHDVATRVFRQIVERRVPVHTTNFVVAESHALVIARSGRYAAWRFLQRIDASAAIVHRASDDDERRARSIVGTHQDKDYTLVDAISFAVMERLGLREAFTFDRHFQQYGFTLSQPT